MKKMKKLFALLMAVAMIMGLAACGSSNKDVVTYKVLTNATFPPFDVLDEETGEVTGFDMDLIAAIGEDQGFKVTFVDMAFEALIPAVQNGDGDIIAAGMWSGDPDRQAKVDFSDDYWVGGAALLVKADNTKITGLSSLTKDMKVATQIATNYADDMTAKKENGELGDVIILDGFDTCVLQLLNGDVDAVVAGIDIVKAYQKKNPDKLKVADEGGVYEAFGFAVQKGNSELLEKINAGLKNVKENGKMDELIKKWELA